MILPLVTLLFSSSCKKSDSNSNCTLSSTTIVGAYIRTADTYQATANSPVIDELAREQPCDRDDILTLKYDGKYTWTDGVLVCGTRPNGTWSLKGNSMTIDGSIATVKSFDCKTLVISTPSGTYPIEITTFSRQ